jgi:hypothetical protein
MVDHPLWKNRSPLHYDDVKTAFPLRSRGSPLHSAPSGDSFHLTDSESYTKSIDAGKAVASAQFNTGVTIASILSGCESGFPRPTLGMREFVALIHRA